MKSDEAAYQIWPILIATAKERTKITYKALGESIGRGHRFLNWPLGRVQEFCLESGLPPLTILVVSKARGSPSRGFTAWDLTEEQAGFEAVWNHTWSGSNPFSFAADGTSINGLVASLCLKPEEAAKIYSVVSVRGTVQMIFRRSVLNAYGQQCAMCGLSFSECLEAAHIIPWNRATAAQRISPTNGLCLCATHHKMFDTGRLTICPNGKVVCAFEGDTTFSLSDFHMTVDLNGKDAYLPLDATLRPSQESLASHYQTLGWDQEPWSLIT